MAIKFRHRGELFIADTPEEAIKMRALLKNHDAETRFKMQFGSLMEQAQAVVELQQPIWTPESFIAFVDRLGAPQRAALAAMVTRRQVTDEELRKAVHVSGNQALAGVLSGISKQAAALGIPARAIFSFENFRHAGKRRSKYSIADDFLKIASDMNWPPASLTE